MSSEFKCDEISFGSNYLIRSQMSWWRHQMETFSALLAPVTGEFPSQRPVTWSFDVFFDLCLNKWVSKQNNGDTGDLRHHCTHSDVTVMACHDYPLWSNKGHYHGHEWSIHNPFAPCQADLLFPEIWLFEKFDLENRWSRSCCGHIVGTSSTQFTSFLFYIYQSILFWDTAISKFDLKTKVKVKGEVKDQCHIIEFGDNTDLLWFNKINS